MEQITKEQLKQMKSVDIHTVNPNTLRDIRNVTVDPALPLNDRIKSFLQQIGNPYCYKCGKYVVKVSYTENGGSIDERLESCLRSLV